MLAQLQASFNRQLEECSRGVIRKIDKMQQQALKARECATQLNEATDASAPEMSVPCISDSVRDLASALKQPSTSGVPEGDKATGSSGRGTNPTDSGARRALDKMMGGKLQTENAFTSLDIKVDKWEAWMENIAPEAMTDAQAAKFSAYQEQLRAIKEKQEAMRAKLQEELKKMRYPKSAYAYLFIQERTYGYCNSAPWRPSNPDRMEFSSGEDRHSGLPLSSSFKDKAPIYCDRRQVDLLISFLILSDHVRQVYEEELLLNTLASARLTDSITQETTWRKTGAELRMRLEASKSTIEETNRELQKQQCSCWLLEDERTSAQQEQRDKATALTAALGTGHVPSDVIALISKRLNDALAPQGAQEQGDSVEAQEEPEQALRRECAALSCRLDAAVGSLKAELCTGSEGPLCKLLEASRDSAYAQRRLALAGEVADAEQQKLARIKMRLELSQKEEATLRLQLEASSTAFEEAQHDVDLLLRVKKGIVGELPSSIAALHEPFDFTDSCLVSQGAVDGYKQEIIANGREKLRILQAIKTATSPNSVIEKPLCSGGDIPTSGSAAVSKQQRDLGSPQWVSQQPADSLKDGQENEAVVERLEEARAELERKSATVLAEIKQRVCSTA
ncbi:hypothetical protein, conserved [Eimeria brunetti]|uniref:Uncharacterized protein n=1 Tax=Eimeria brunetti TaxID=51314 RepID=U6LF72_9EIME|nr:hypothetical protein, conserved [Eimeria brunetti]